MRRKTFVNALRNLDLLNWDSVHDHSDRTFYSSHRAQGKSPGCDEAVCLPQAKAELQVAQEIDPSLADVKTLLQATEFLTELGLNAKVGLYSNYEQLDHVDPSLVLIGLIGFWYGKRNN